MLCQSEAAVSVSQNDILVETNSEVSNLLLTGFGVPLYSYGS